MTRARIAWVLWLAALLVPWGAGAQSLEELFRRGNAAYFDGRFADAIRNYETIAQAGVADPAVYGNLATAHARNGELGHAVLYFERASRVAPGDSEVMRALQVTRTALGKRQAQTHGEAVVVAKPPLGEALVRSVTENTLAYLVLAFQVLLFGSLLLRRRAASDAVRTGFSLSAALAALGLAAAGLLLLQKRGVFDEGEAAIVLRDGTTLREGPDPRARTRARAHEGASARVLSRDGSFVRIRVQGGPEGWTTASAIGVIAPD
jgi:tetratricopeptide (TPR) repeat protein